MRRLTRRMALQCVAAALVFPASAQTPAADGLRARAARRHLLYGCAASTPQLADTRFSPVLAREAGVLVAEYEMKRGYIEKKLGVFDFSAGDRLLSFTKAHDMAFRGHTLCWYRSNPSWLEEAAARKRDTKLLTGYIQSVAGRYKGKVHSWDVVNEAIEPDDGRADGLRNSFWLKAYGPSYVDMAFHAARAADPNALLVYNDYGCETGLADNDRRRAAVLKFLEGALARRVPIDALGLQCHLRAYGAKVDQGKLHKFLDDLKALGLRILVTEHDVSDAGGPSDIAIRDRAVADTSRRFLDVVLANSATTAVLTWGLSDRYGKQGRRALPLDKDMRRKPMWQALAKAFG